jgi:hypothetical protein
MLDLVPDTAIKGRGAVGNLAGRFDNEDHYKIDDMKIK